MEGTIYEEQTFTRYQTCQLLDLGQFSGTVGNKFQVFINDH
jgi:hypothetical protein